jgi:hypothetical protein
MPTLPRAPPTCRPQPVGPAIDPYESRYCPHLGIVPHASSSCGKDRLGLTNNPHRQRKGTGRGRFPHKTKSTEALKWAGENPVEVGTNYLCMTIRQDRMVRLIKGTGHYTEREAAPAAARPRTTGWLPRVASHVRGVALAECARSAGTIDAFGGWRSSDNRRIQNVKSTQEAR